MALFEYDLFLVRTHDGAALRAEMMAQGDLLPDGEDAATVLGTLRSLVRQYPRGSRPGELAGVLRLGFMRHQIGAMLETDARRFLDWLWMVFERYRLDYAFMGGADVYRDYHSREPVTDQGVTEQLEELLTHGTVRFPHPLMLFAQQLAGGRPCAYAGSAPHYKVEQKPGVGCLLVLADEHLAGDTLEILQPGLIYPYLVRYFREAARGAANAQPDRGGSE